MDLWHAFFSYAASLHQPTKQIASLLPVHIYQEHLRNMLNHMQHFVAEAVHILRPRTSPPNHHHGFSHINIRIGYPLIRFTFEHEITGIFERNAAASQIPKILFPFNLKLLPHIFHSNLSI